MMHSTNKQLFSLGRDELLARLLPADVDLNSLIASQNSESVLHHRASHFRIIHDGLRVISTVCNFDAIELKPTFRCHGFKKICKELDNLGVVPD